MANTRAEFVRDHLPACLRDGPNLIAALDNPASVLRIIFDIGIAYGQTPAARPAPGPDDSPLVQYVLSDSAGQCLIVYAEDDETEQQVRRDWWLANGWNVDDVKDVGWLDAKRDLAKEAQASFTRIRVNSVIAIVNGARRGFDGWFKRAGVANG